MAASSAGLIVSYPRTATHTLTARIIGGDESERTRGKRERARGERGGRKRALIVGEYSKSWGVWGWRRDERCPSEMSGLRGI